MIDEQLRKVIEGIANTYGDEFFVAITGHLHDTIGADYTFVAHSIWRLITLPQLH